MAGLEENPQSVLQMGLKSAYFSQCRLTASPEEWQMSWRTQTKKKLVKKAQTKSRSRSNSRCPQKEQGLTVLHDCYKLKNSSRVIELNLNTNKNDSKQIQHVLHTSSNLDTVVKQHWGWKKLWWKFQILLAHIHKDTPFRHFVFLSSPWDSLQKIYMINIDCTNARPLILVHKDIGNFYPPCSSTPSSVTEPKMLDIFIWLNVKNITFPKEMLLLKVRNLLEDRIRNCTIP